MATNSAELLSAYASFVRNHEDDNVLAKLLEKSIQKQKKSSRTDYISQISSYFTTNKGPFIAKLKKIMQSKNGNNTDQIILKNFVPQDLVYDETDIDLFADEFISIAKKLYPKLYPDEIKQQIKTGFISLFSYNVIDPNSTGLYNPETLSELFEKFYLNSNGESTNSDAFKNAFFQKTNYLPEGKRTITGPLNLYENHFLVFNPNLWFEYFETDFNIIDIVTNYHDSFAYFVNFPELESIEHTDLGTIKSPVLKTFSGNYRKLCFVQCKIKVDTKSNLQSLFNANYQGNDIQAFYNTQNVNKGINLYYNLDDTRASKNLINNSGKKKIPSITSTYGSSGLQYLFLQSAGMKKNKLEGGTLNDIFDNNREPYVSFDKENSSWVYTKNNFLSCIEKLTKTKNKKQLLENIMKVYKYLNSTKKYPLVFYDKTTKLASTYQISGIDYEEIRTFFLFSSIYTTLIKLFIGFFENIIKFYQHTITGFEEKIASEVSKKREADSKKINFYEQFNKKSTKLLSYLGKLVVYLKEAILLKNQDSAKNQKNNFAGFNLYFKEPQQQSQDNSNIPFVIKFINLFVNFSYGLAGASNKASTSTKSIFIKEGIFSKFLRDFSNLFQKEIIFGGIQQLLHQDKFLSSYIFYIEFLDNCFKEFMQKKSIKNKNEKQLTSDEISKIKVHTSSLKTQLEAFIQRNPKIKPFMYKLFEIVISKFIDTLYSINSINTSNNSTVSGFNNSSNKGTRILEEILKFKAYIAILEGILNELLKKFSIIDSIPPFDLTTTKLFIIGRFNNFLAILEYIKKEENISSLEELLLGIGFSISFVEKKEKAIEDRIDFFNKFFKINTPANKAPVFNNQFFKDIYEERGVFYTSPDFKNLRWWVKLKEVFNNRIDPTKKHDVRLYVVCVRKNFGNKFQKFTIASNDVLLVDVFSCAQIVSGEKLVINDFLQVRETVGDNGTVTDARYLTSQNTVINLTPFLRKFDDLISWHQGRSKSKRTNRFDATKSFIDFMKYRKYSSTNVKEKSLSAIGYVIRLLQGNLKNESGLPIQAVILQGRNEKQLTEIIKRHMLKTNKLVSVFNSTKIDKTESDYQLISLSKTDYESSDNMRKFLARVMFSSPENYYDQRSALASNLFNIFQRPFSQEFIFKGIFKGGIVYNFFLGIQNKTSISEIIQKFKENYGNRSKSNSNRQLLLNAAASLILKEKIFVDQQELQDLLVLNESNLTILSKIENQNSYENTSNAANAPVEYNEMNSELDRLWSGRSDNSRKARSNQSSSTNRSQGNFRRAATLSQSSAAIPVRGLSSSYYPPGLQRTPHLMSSLPSLSASYPEIPPPPSKASRSSPIKTFNALIQNYTDPVSQEIIDWIRQVRTIPSSPGLDVRDNFIESQDELILVGFKKDNSNYIITVVFKNGSFYVKYYNDSNQESIFGPLRYENGIIFGKSINADYYIILNFYDQAWMTYNFNNQNWDLIKGYSNAFYEFTKTRSQTNISKRLSLGGTEV